VATGGKLKKVQLCDTAELNTRNIPHGPDHFASVVVNDQDSFPLLVTSVSHLSFSRSDLFCPLDFQEIMVHCQLLEQFEGQLGFLQKVD